MSIHSYTSYTCTLPDDTPINERAFASFQDVRFFSSYQVASHDDEHHVRRLEFDGETSWAAGVLNELIEVVGRPLDQVPGLTLDAHFETNEDGHYECNLKISNGRCKFEESEIVMRERPMSECPIDIAPARKEA